MSDPTRICDIREARLAVLYGRARKVLAQPWFGLNEPIVDAEPIEITRLEALHRLNFYDEYATPEGTNMPRGCFATIVGKTMHLG